MTVKGVGGRPRVNWTPDPKPLPPVVTKEDLKPKEPWEQQEGESNKAFAAFKKYLAMGPQRTFKGTSDLCEKNVEIIKTWAGTWLWADRAEAWERHLFRAEMEEYEKHRRDCARENAQIIKDAKELLVHDIKAYLARAKSMDDPTKSVLSPGQFTNMMEAVITLEKMNNELMTNLPASALHKPREVVHRIVYASQDSEGNIVDDPAKPRKKDVVLEATYTVKEDIENESSSN